MLPGLLSAAYFPAVVAFTLVAMTRVGIFINERVMPEWMRSTVVTALLLGILYIIGFVTGFLLYRTVIMIVYSPALGYMSEAVEKQLGGTMSPEFSCRGFAYDAIRGSSLSILTFVLSVAVFGLCWIISLLPLVGAVVSVFLLPLSQMYLAGVGFSDPALERRRYSVRRSLGFCWKNRGRLIGHGLGFSLLLAIPLIGWFLAPSYGIIAGTVGVVSVLKADAMPEDGMVDATPAATTD